MLDTFGKGDDSRRLNSSRLDYTAGVGLCKVGVWGRRLRRRPPHWVCPNFVGLGRRPFRLAVNGQAQARMRRYCNLTNYSDNPLPCPWAGVPGPQPSPHPLPPPLSRSPSAAGEGRGWKEGFCGGRRSRPPQNPLFNPPSPPAARPGGEGGQRGGERVKTSLRLLSEQFVKAQKRLSLPGNPYSRKTGGRFQRPAQPQPGRLRPGLLGPDNSGAPPHHWAS